MKQIQLQLRRAIHSSLKSNGRLRLNIKLRPPITPTVRNIEVSESHPLWQFFYEKKLLRSPEDLNDQENRAWTVPELRRKSFDDLHSLWYNCLKERNSLAREADYISSLKGSPGLYRDDSFSESYSKVSDEIRITMWRIRHVLSERQHAFENVQKVMPEYKQQFLENFRERYLEAHEAESEEIQEQLDRLNWAIFGININSQADFKASQDMADCAIYNANIKVEKYGTDQQKETYKFADAYDALPLFIEAVYNKATLAAQLEVVENNRQAKDFNEIIKLVPAKQIERAIIKLAGEEDEV